MPPLHGNPSGCLPFVLLTPFSAGQESVFEAQKRAKNSGGGLFKPDLTRFCLGLTVCGQKTNIYAEER